MGDDVRREQHGLECGARIMAEGVTMRRRRINDPMCCPHRESECVVICINVARERCLDCGQWLGQAH